MCASTRHKLYNCFILFFIAFFALSSTTGKLQAEEVIRIGYFVLPPHAYLDNGIRKGTAVEYWQKYIAPEMGVKVKWYGPYNLKRLLLQIKQGKIDAILTLAKTSDRIKIINYPQNGFYKMSAGVLLPKTHQMKKINSLKDLEQLKLCFLAGAYIPLQVKQIDIQWKLEYGNDWKKQCLQKTALNEIDGSFDLMTLSLEYSMRLYNLRKAFKIIPLPGLDMPIYTAFSRKARATLLARYNAAHNKFLKENRFDKIISDFLKEK